MIKFLHKTFFLYLLFVGSIPVSAQFTEVINSNKPGFSESPYSVGTGIYQFESSLFLRDLATTSNFSIPQSLGIDLFFRTSFLLERLEINTQISYQRDKIITSNTANTSFFSTGIAGFTVGAKYLIYQQEYEDKSKEVRSWKRKFAFDKKRLIPSVAIYAGLNTDFVNEIYKKGSMSPKLGLLLQHNLSNDFNLITNVFYDNIGTDFSAFSYIITATYNFSDQWSTFFENQTLFEPIENKMNLGTGLAFLYSKDLQINASARLLVEGRFQGFYTSLGVSYRINNHKDAFKELDENGNEIKDTPASRYNKKGKGFFNRLFSIFTGKKSKNKRPKRSRKRNKN